MAAASASLPPVKNGLDAAHALLLNPIHDTEPPSPTKRHTKVTVVGVGNVGMAIVHAILSQHLADELALIDAQADKLRGEVLDLQHAAAFLPRTTIKSSTDVSSAAYSDLCIITAGARQRPEESRLDLLKRNVQILSAIVPRLARAAPNSTILVVSNPVDVLTYVTYRLSGFPANRVIGSGTNLDSSRFRFMIAEHLRVNAHDVQAYMVGEHGDSSVALWSSVSVGGVGIVGLVKGEDAVLEEMRERVVKSAYEVIALKGYTSWAIGYSVGSLAGTLLRDQRKIQPVSVVAKGFHGIEEEVFLSLPAQLGRNGVIGVVNVELTEEETKRLRASAKKLWEVQQELGI
ncbi:hypothetical protein AMTRI_Chr08g166670 [Amborella trichopoda]|uniref:L-lactate dehydrogenase n=1 Tax=Amborella trichopoda TaxID=13333 RepID=W1P5V6_AMBTC|nr:L-lactate dehydrogenase B [Amborella trichopoda]ERN05237.1 hypothetical protein AMTR_s00007p00083810 [Amborella trichopoda]|eukprot:XP_006843562.1 L-lactate dehydrogenase B [Amborella trichopoda]